MFPKIAGSSRLGGVHKLRLQDLAFFDHLPPSVYIFYGIKVYKKSTFLTTYPPPLVNVVCERPLTQFYHIWSIDLCQLLKRSVFKDDSFMKRLFWSVSIYSNVKNVLMLFIWIVSCSLKIFFDASVKIRISLKCNLLVRLKKKHFVALKPNQWNIYFYIYR